MENKIYCRDCKWVGDLIHYYFLEKPSAEELDRTKNNRECNCLDLVCYNKYDTPFEHIKYKIHSDINNCNKNNDCKCFEIKE